MTLYQSIARPLLFSLGAERSHSATIKACSVVGRSGLGRRVLSKLYPEAAPSLNISVAGLALKTPVCLAAGFDKSAQAIEVTSRLGFGAIEIGSVSEHPSKGNPSRPRIWRLKNDRALRVYYGCPNDGAKVVADRVEHYSGAVPLGVSIVDTNTGNPPVLEHATAEMVEAIRRFVSLASYITLNLSCPNTPRGSCGIFDERAGLQYLLDKCSRIENLPPVFLKITPPVDPQSPQVIDAILETTSPFAFVRGFILNVHNPDPLANLTTPKSTLATTIGGITGPPIKQVTRDAISAWFRRIDHKRFVLVGVGGVENANDAYGLIRAGASLVQLYTTLVYGGPGTVQAINEGLGELLRRDGYAIVEEAIGADHAAADTTGAVRPEKATTAIS